MPRGGHKVKPVKAIQLDVPVPLDAPALSSATAEPKRTNTNWKGSILAAKFISRSSSANKLPDPIFEQPPAPQDVSKEWTPQIELPTHSTGLSTGLACDEGQQVMADGLLNEQEPSVQLSLQPTAEKEEQREEQDTNEAVPDTFNCTNNEAVLSGSSASIYSRSSASIYSRASSIYSSEASIYSFEDGGMEDFDRYTRHDSTDMLGKELDSALDSRLPNALQYQQRARPVLRRQETQDIASKERTTLAKKAALFKNSRLSPELPTFSTDLPTWSMVCRAAKASQDCYDSQALTRRGTYTPANTSRDIKAMIVDDQRIDGSRFIIISIRGTQSQSLTDWSVNTTANPTKPVGILDDEENACHAGFLQVTKAMAGRVATQLQQHPALAEAPSLLFTGHSAGGAIAALLYSHMLSTSVNSELTTLANQFTSINCITFGAPPVSQTPLLRCDHMPGVFLAFANEGDLVVRMSNSAYFKSLAKLMTASPPSSTASAVAPPPVKVVRGSRGAAVYRQAAPAPPPTPWEELPLWPTPAPSLTNAGEIILLRDGHTGSATASPVTSEDLNEVIFGDLTQHTIEMYLRRVKELALSAMLGRDL